MSPCLNVEGMHHQELKPAYCDTERVSIYNQFVGRMSVELMNVFCRDGGNK